MRVAVTRLPLQLVILFIFVCVMVLSPVVAQSSDELVVRAVLFYSPTCPHCHYVINEVLIPMVDEYGDQLQIVGIDTSQSGGAQLYQVAIERYQVPTERRGVPTLVVGDVVLVGGNEIPEQFPSLFEEGLAAGGIDWPDIPGLAEVLSEGDPESSPTSAPPATASPTPSPTAAPAPSLLTAGGDEILSDETQKPPSDPVGFVLAGMVLVGMVVSFGYAARRVAAARRRLFRFSGNPGIRVKTWAIPFSALLGLGVAAYLAHVEISHAEAVCGPVGECNIVQTSAYAVMLGVPVAVWGVFNYLAVGALWAGQRYLLGRWANKLAQGLLGLTLFGVLFSIYLTCLELFVIHAICLWCLSSAVITTVAMLLVVIPVTRGWSYADL